MTPTEGQLLRIEIVLLAPEIPQNTGSIGRMCVNLGLKLHLIEPLGFSLEEKMIRRSGLDYWPHLDKIVHRDWPSYLEQAQPQRILFASTKTTRSLYSIKFCAGDHIVFGRESSGLPPEFYQKYADQLFTIPMPGEHRRSLNLSNAAAVVAYEAYRQLDLF